MTVAATALLNVGLNLWWIPTLGLIGAAYATLVSYAAGLVLSFALGYRVLALPIPTGDLLRILAASAGMVLTLLPFRDHTGLMSLSLQVIAGGLVYAILVGVLNPGRVRDLLGRQANPGSAE
jgi:O-antigen/teichoic acid export membrane protein